MSKLAHSCDETMRHMRLREDERGKVITTFFQCEHLLEWRAYREGSEPDDRGNMTVGVGNNEDDAIADLLMLEDE